MNSGHVKRRYDASRRQAQARQLRLDVAAAARALFIERGFAATTIADVAQAANVSTQFIYAAFGGKRGLLAKVIDWTLAGDDEPIPMAQRPSILAVQQEPTLTGKCALYARHARMVADRIAQTLQMLRAAADADADARAIYETGEAQRRTGAALFVANLRRVGELRAGLSEEQAADAIWALSPDILWNLLVIQRGWTPGQFELWYAGQLAAAVLDDKHLPAVRRFSHKLLAATTPTPTATTDRISDA
jgi:TetR/AcrR family transcriptional regulator, regulator of autoinduction and epiphytic fitness